jgi:transcription initiation factor IIE alpha subunit
MSRRSQKESEPEVKEIQIGLSYEQRLEALKVQKDYYAFKYVKSKEGNYEGMYFCCNCKSTMTRLVKSWNKELGTYGFGPFELQRGQKVIVPSYEYALAKFKV